MTLTEALAAEEAATVAVIRALHRLDAARARRVRIANAMIVIRVKPKPHEANVAFAVTQQADADPYAVRRDADPFGWDK